MNLEECRAAIHIAVGVSKNIDDAVAALRQEEARLEAGLALTPRELVEALRAHARRRVEMGRRVEFVRQDQWVMASPYDGAWRFNTARYEQKASREHVLDWVAEATAFAANVD